MHIDVHNLKILVLEFISSFHAFQRHVNWLMLFDSSLSVGYVYLDTGIFSFLFENFHVFRRFLKGQIFIPISGDVSNTNTLRKL